MKVNVMNVWLLYSVDVRVGVSEFHCGKLLVNVANHSII